MNNEPQPPKFYSVDEIFEDIPGDPEHTMLKIPPELYENMGWKEGDNIKITVSDGIITLTNLSKNEQA